MSRTLAKAYEKPAYPHGLEHRGLRRVQFLVMAILHFVHSRSFNTSDVGYSRVLDKDENNTVATDQLEALGLERVSAVSEAGCL